MKAMKIICSSIRVYIRKMYRDTETRVQTGGKYENMVMTKLYIFLSLAFGLDFPFDV